MAKFANIVPIDEIIEMKVVTSVAFGVVFISVEAAVFNVIAEFFVVISAAAVDITIIDAVGIIGSSIFHVLLYTDDIIALFVVVVFNIGIVVVTSFIAAVDGDSVINEVAIFVVLAGDMVVVIVDITVTIPAVAMLVVIAAVASIAIVDTVILVELAVLNVDTIVAPSVMYTVVFVSVATAVVAAVNVVFIEVL